MNALQNELYPVIGLQTPGEVVEANFGQEPFLFDFKGELREAQLRINVQVLPALLIFPICVSQCLEF